MKMVYIAGPITHGDLFENIKQANEAGCALARAGISPIVPHGSCFWGNNILGTGREEKPVAFVPSVNAPGLVPIDFYNIDLEMVRRSDAVLRLPGVSEGADLETEEALTYGKPVFLSVEAVIKWANTTTPKRPAFRL